MTADLESEFGVGQQGPVGDFDPPELGEEDFSEHTAQMVAKTLEDTGLIQIADVQHGIGYFHVMGRVKGDKENIFLEKVVVPFLRSAKGHCKEFAGKQYFLKDDEPVYGWVFSLQSNNLREAANKVCEGIAPAIVRVEGTESPLVGQGTPQGLVGGGRGLPGRKGAAPVRG